MKLTYQVFYILFFLITSLSVKAQIGYGTNAPQPSSVIDMTSANKGFLPTRVKLTATNVASPIVSPANYLLVYNTETAGVAPNNVKPGYYYYLTNKWIRLSDDPYWDLAGNAGNSAAVNYIGTSDNQDLIFKVNNIRAGLLNSNLRNTSLGREALSPSTSGTDNVAIGNYSLVSNSSGSNNISTGYQAMLFNNAGSDNIAAGYQSLFQNSGSRNIGLGIQNLYSNAGNGNVAMLQNVLFSNTSGNYNFGVGLLALFSNNTGSNNIAIGYSAMQNNNTGSNNIGLGLQALVSTNSSNNIGIGSFTLFNNVSGTNNIAISSGALGGLNNNTSNFNLANGYQSLQNLQTGSNNSAIGYNSLNSQTSASNVNGIGSGIYFASATTSNQLNISNAIFGTGFSGSTVTTPVGKIGVNITSPNSTLHVFGSTANAINALNTGTLTAQNFTVLVSGDLVLPQATTCKGRTYILVNDTPASPVTSSNITIQSAGSFISAGVVSTSLTISNGGLKKVTVQSDGTNWQLISKFQ